MYMNSHYTDKSHERLSHKFLIFIDNENSYTLTIASFTGIDNAQQGGGKEEMGVLSRHRENFWAFTGPRIDFGLILLMSNMIIHMSFTGVTHLLSASLRTGKFRGVWLWCFFTSIDSHYEDKIVLWLSIFNGNPYAWKTVVVLKQLSGDHFNIKMPYYQYKKSQCGDNMILWLSYLQNRISYSSSKTSLYWISPHLTSSLSQYAEDSQCRPSPLYNHKLIYIYSTTDGTRLVRPGKYML